MQGNHRTHRAITLATAAAIVTLAAARPAHPVVKSWTLNGVGLYLDPFNWTGISVPQSTDSVLIHGLNGQMVFPVGLDVGNEWMRVENASFSLNLAGTTYTLWGDDGFWTDGMSLQVATEANSLTTLIVENGTIVGEKAAFGELAGSSAWCQVESDASLELNDMIVAGSHGYGGLAIIGGTASASGVRLGAGPGAGELYVTSGASMSLGGVHSVFGDQGTGRLDMHSGGDLSIQANVTFGAQPSGRGLAFIRDSGTTLDVGNTITIGSDGTGEFTVYDGADVEAYRILLADDAGSSGELTIEDAGSTVSLDDDLEIGSGGAVLVSGAAELNVDGATSIDFGGSVQLDEATLRTGQLLGDGNFYWNASSRLEVTDGNLQIGENGPALDLHVWSRELEVSGDWDAYDDGTYAVISVKNGDASCGGNAYLGRITDSLGRLDVEQSSYAHIGDSLYVGGIPSVSGGTGIVNLEDGGNLSVGDLVRVWETSTVNVDAQSRLWCDELDLAGGAVVADGEVNVIKGEALLLLGNNGLKASGFGSTASVVVREGGTLETAGGEIASFIGSEATVEVRDGGSTWMSDGDVTIGRADGAAVQGTLTVADGGRVESTTGLTIHTNGVLVLEDGDVEAPLVQNGGRLVGSGDIHGAVENDALVAPGASPGLIRMVGPQAAYTQGAAGQLDVELAGTTAADFDRLQVYGDVQLAGELRISTIDGFQPELGDTFQIITAYAFAGGTVTGTFDTVTPSALYDVIYDELRVIVEVIAVCPADVDGSGHVGFEDLAQLLGNWGPCAGACPWDLDGSGEVGFDDLVQLLGAWGACS